MRLMFGYSSRPNTTKQHAMTPNGKPLVCKKGKDCVAALLTCKLILVKLWLVLNILLSGLVDVIGQS